MHRDGFWVLMALSLAALVAGCDSQEAVRIRLPVEAQGGGLAPAVTNRGWRVSIHVCRLALRDLQLTIHGEMHAGLLQRAAEQLLPRAHAHPGHHAGGEVTGELPGRFVADFGRGGLLGTATLLPGQYRGANFTFRRADAQDGLDATDPLLGHSAYLEGVAEREGVRLQLRAQIDLAEGAQVVGVPFEAEITASTTATLRLQALQHDPVGGQSLLDGLDLAAYDPDGDGRVEIAPGGEAHNVLRRRIRMHEFYHMQAR
ncbi:MAG: hypothetical protein RMK29_14360 [Myxococcales bacterium]|nr:hypothetical protein [Myxococcales bacterium]